MFSLQARIREKEDHNPEDLLGQHLRWFAYNLKTDLLQQSYCSNNNKKNPLPESCCYPFFLFLFFFFPPSFIFLQLSFFFSFFFTWVVLVTFPKQLFYLFCSCYHFFSLLLSSSLFLYSICKIAPCLNLCIFSLFFCVLFSGGKVKGEMKKKNNHASLKIIRALSVVLFSLCFFRWLFCTGVNAAFRSQYPAESHQSCGTDSCHTETLHLAICLSILSLVFLPQQCYRLANSSKK